MHYARWQRNGDPTVILRVRVDGAIADRLAVYIDRSAGPDACWPWTGPKASGGYGLVSAKPRPIRAHRAAYEAVHGPIPDGLIILHACDNPPCCNPDHLSLGTHATNARDKIVKGRAPRGESHPNAKMTDAEIVEAKALRGFGLTYREVATRFGVSGAGIRHIILGERRAG